MVIDAPSIITFGKFNLKTSGDIEDILLTDKKVIDLKQRSPAFQQSLSPIQQMNWDLLQAASLDVLDRLTGQLRVNRFKTHKMFVGCLKYVGNVQPARMKHLTNLSSKHAGAQKNYFKSSICFLYHFVLHLRSTADLWLVGRFPPEPPPEQDSKFQD